MVVDVVDEAANPVAHLGLATRHVVVELRLVRQLRAEERPHVGRRDHVAHVQHAHALDAGQEIELLKGQDTGLLRAGGGPG